MKPTSTRQITRRRVKKYLATTRLTSSLSAPKLTPRARLFVRCWATVISIVIQHVMIICAYLVIQRYDNLCSRMESPSLKSVNSRKRVASTRRFASQKTDIGVDVRDMCSHHNRAAATGCIRGQCQDRERYQAGVRESTCCRGRGFLEHGQVRG